MLELRADLQERIDAFERCIATRFIEIGMMDLGHMREEVDIFQAEVSSLTKSHMTAISLVIPQWLRYHLRVGPDTLIYL